MRSVPDFGFVGGVFLVLLCVSGRLPADVSDWFYDRWLWNSEIFEFAEESGVSAENRGFLPKKCGEKEDAGS